MTNLQIAECRLDRRRIALVAAAKALFIEKGYEGTTLGDIVERAGGSLSTLYKLFGNKDGLLEAVISQGSPSGEILIADALSLGGTPQQILYRLAQSLHPHFLHPDTVAIVRIVIARSMAEPNFARQFFERTSTRTRTALEAMFEGWQASGTNLTASPAILAELFLDLFVSDIHAEAISHGMGFDHSPERLLARTRFFVMGAGLGDPEASTASG